MKTKDKAGIGCGTIIMGWIALSIAASALRSCGVFTGDLEKDVIEDGSSYMKKKFEDAKQYLEEPVQDMHQTVSKNVPLLKDATQVLADNVKPQFHVDTSTAPCGSFYIDLKAQKGSNKRFSFDVLGREENGDIRLTITEYGGKDTELGGSIKFNVVYWEPDQESKKGIGFCLSFNPRKGCLLLPFDSKVKPLVYIGEGDRLCVELSPSVSTNQKSTSRNVSQKIIFSHDIPPFYKGETLQLDSPRLVKARNVPVSRNIKNAYKVAQAPIEIPEKTTIKKYKIYGRPVTAQNTY